MEPYLFIYLIMVALVPADRLRLPPLGRLACLSIPFVLLLLLAGTRVETGNDWMPYYQFYSRLTGLDEKEDFEIGYRLFAYISKSFGLSYSQFLFLSTLTYLGVFFAVFRKQRGAIALALLFYCTYLLGWMGTARQVIAISLTVLAGQQLLEGRSWRFVGLVLVAASFHQTAIIFLLARYLRRPIVSLKIYVFIILLCIVIGEIGRAALPLIIERLLGAEEIGGKVLFYSGLGSKELDHASGEILGMLWYVKRLAFLLFFLALRKRFNTPKLSFYLNAYLVSVAIFLILQPILPILATRGSNYFSIYELFLLASLVTRKARWSVLIIPFVVLLAGQRLYVSLYAYHPYLYVPYKGQFINDDFRRIFL